MAVKAIIS